MAMRIPPPTDKGEHMGYAVHKLRIDLMPDTAAGFCVLAAQKPCSMPALRGIVGTCS